VQEKDCCLIIEKKLYFYEWYLLEIHKMQKKVLTFRKTRFIIADINDEGVRNENLFLALFLLQGNTS